MNERIQELMEQASNNACYDEPSQSHLMNNEIEKFAELIVRDCIYKIESYRIPVGNSPAGEMASEWTYNALKEIRNVIKEHFGVK